MAVGEISCTSSGMPARAFRAFNNNAEEAPSRVLVRPVRTLPVSYTHLDVYKRQALEKSTEPWFVEHIYSKLIKKMGI